ncbi:hypothetical protein GGQ68_002497 [Sagittula marina]|uniref:Uncharacterized protein n=1 Tax=Sagittula marina TaxID=943940 RepID=A0A7W6DVQ2_9RHOB|nr:hypothetical protein [Sagittula marina]MBB3986159.1 hypothetical protein [Sagittula marina]
MSVGALTASVPMGLLRLDLGAVPGGVPRWTLVEPRDGSHADKMLAHGDLGPDGMTSSMMLSVAWNVDAFERIAGIADNPRPDLVAVATVLALATLGGAEVLPLLPVVDAAIKPPLPEGDARSGIRNALSMVEHDALRGDQPALDTSLHVLRVEVMRCAAVRGGLTEALPWLKVKGEASCKEEN